MQQNYRIVSIGYTKTETLLPLDCHVATQPFRLSSKCANASTPAREANTLHLLHHLLRSNNPEAQIAILKQLASEDNIRKYSAILLNCVTRSIVFGREYHLLKHFAEIIMPNGNDEDVRHTIICASLRNEHFLHADGAVDFLLALGPLKASEPLYKALHFALNTHHNVTVSFWSKSIHDNLVTVPPGLLHDFFDMAKQYTATEEPILTEMASISSRLAAHPRHKNEIINVSQFPALIIDWLHGNNVLADTAADIMSNTAALYDWSRHRKVRKRLWDLAAEGRGLTAVIKVVAPKNTKLSFVRTMAKHINVEDADVDESSILAAQAVKRMTQSLSVRVKAYPESLDLLATLSYAKNRHVRFWAIQGLSEQSQLHARFYLARSNLCLRALLVAMKKDHCLRVRTASATAIFNICKDPANAVTLVRRSDVLPALVACIWNGLERPEQRNCNIYVEAVLALVSHKAVDPDRLAMTFRLVACLIKYGNHDNPELDRELQQTALWSAALLEPFRQPSFVS